MDIVIPQTREDRLFKGWSEFANLFAPALFIPLIFIELLAPNLVSLSQRIFLLNFVEVGLGSAGHNGLSWGLLFLTPEGGLWLQDKGGKKKIFEIFLTAIIIFSLATFIFCISWDQGGLIVQAFLFVDWFLIHHHSLSQTRGLTFMYHYSAAVSPSQKKVISNLHTPHKLAFTTLLILGQIPALHYIFNLPILQSSAEKVLFFIISLAVVFFIFYLNFSVPGEKKRHRMLYLLRLLYFPFLSFSFVSALAYRFIHGIEYLFIYKRLINSSKENSSVKVKTLIFFSVLLFLLAVILWCFSMNPNEGVLAIFSFKENIPIWLRLLAAVSVTRLYMHYYLDRQIFGFKDPDTLNRFGKLLKS